MVQDSRLSESSRERLSGEGLGVDGSGGKSTDMDASTGAISSQVSSSWFRNTLEERPRLTWTSGGSLSETRNGRRCMPRARETAKVSFRARRARVSR